MPKKIPVRQCVACRQQKEKPQLSGRGAYLCKSASCLEKAIKSRALARALDCEIPAEVYDTLRGQFAEEEVADGK